MSRGNFAVVNWFRADALCLVPDSVLLVDNIDAASISKSGRWQAIQLLGNGQLCIQDLLNEPLHYLV